MKIAKISLSTTAECPPLFDTYAAAAKEAIEHARRNLITDEDPKNITSYTGFAQ